MAHRGRGNCERLTGKAKKGISKVKGYLRSFCEGLRVAYCIEEAAVLFEYLCLETGIV